MSVHENIPAHIEGATNQLGWQIGNRSLHGSMYVVAIRDASIDENQNLGIPLSMLESERRRVVLGKGSVAFVVQPPVCLEDVSAISKLEGVLLYSDSTREVVEPPSALPKLLEDITDKQDDVIKRILLPEPEIGEELGLTTQAVRDRLLTVQRKYFESKMDLVVRALYEESVDTSGISQSSTLRIPMPLQTYITEDGYHARENTKEWREICTKLGAKNKYEVFAMAARDGLIDLEAVILQYSTVQH